MIAKLEEAMTLKKFVKANTLKDVAYWIASVLDLKLINKFIGFADLSKMA